MARSSPKSQPHQALNSDSDSDSFGAKSCTQHCNTYLSIYTALTRHQQVHQRQETAANPRHRPTQGRSLTPPTTRQWLLIPTPIARLLAYARTEADCVPPFLPVPPGVAPGVLPKRVPPAESRARHRSWRVTVLDFSGNGTVCTRTLAPHDE